MTDCSLRCDRFYNGSLGDRLTISCTANSMAHLEDQLLYFDDVNVNPAARSISPYGVHDQTHFFADEFSMVMSIDSLQPQHFISYTFSAKCKGSNLWTNHLFALVEETIGVTYLSELDYIIFALFMVVSTVIGVGFALWTFMKQKKAKKDPTTADFLLANRSLHCLPLSLSLLATFLSAITLQGTPSEIYVFGTQYLAVCFGYVLFMPIAAHVFLPLFYKLGITSLYEYLEQRFSPAIRRIGAAIYLFNMLLYMAMVIYTPSIALQAVSGFNMWASAIITCGVCTFYTTLGGLRAAVWTDVFQALFMVAGVIAVLVQGSYREGGLFERAWTIAERGGRIEFFNFDPNPLLRHSFWTVVIGGSVTTGLNYWINQALVQRALSATSLRAGQLVYWSNLPGLLLFTLLPGLCGIIVYARYADCDPMLTGRIQKRDQLLPLYVMEILSKDLPGFPGLFVAMLFAGTLSTISSGLNALAAVFVRDFASQFFFDPFNFSETRRSRFTRLFTLVFGIVTILLVFLVDLLPGVLDAALAISSAFGGPILAMFIIGIFMPFVKWESALIALVLSLAFNVWIILGNMISAPRNYDSLQLSIEACPVENATLFYEKVPVNFDEMSDLDHLYSISYMYYSTIGAIAAILIALGMTLIFGCDDTKRYSGGLSSPRTIRWTEAVWTSRKTLGDKEITASKEHEHATSF